MPGKSLGKGDDDNGENGAENEAPVLGQRLQLILQQGERERADDRAEEVGEAAEHRHEYELARLRPVDQFGVGQSHAKAEDRSAGCAVCRRNDKGGEASAVHVNAEIFGLAGIVAHGFEMQPEG